MTEDTKISWCDSTFNPWIGCSKVGPGCDNCYAESMMDHRLHVAKWGPGNPRTRTSEKNWRDPLKWEREHEQFFAEHGRRRRVFCSSLADVFDNEVDPKWRSDLFDLIDATPHLDWLLLTKRIGNVRYMIPDRWSISLPPHVWLGITVVNQEEADRDVYKLLTIKAHTRFLSMEPLLGDIDMAQAHKSKEHLPRIDWGIVGTESGHNRRVAKLECVQSIVDQFQFVGVPIFVKQIELNGRVETDIDKFPEGLMVREFPA